MVRYIVQQTLGKILEEGSLEPALNIKVLDPACGSGSFLLEAFDFLDNFIAHERNEIPGDDPEADAMRRKDILTNNLYGVDLDGQAVEITKLNLWLRAVNNRDKLPTIPNIRQGNSLIDNPDLVNNMSFNWEQSFPQVIKQGGFDVIIGNPPYIRIQNLPESQKQWFKEAYTVASGNYDIYVLFVEKAVQLLKNTGMCGFILPNKFFSSNYGQALRSFLSKRQALVQIVNFGNAQIFQNATTYTTLLFLQGQPRKKVSYFLAEKYVKDSNISSIILNTSSMPSGEIDSTLLGDDPWIFTALEDKNLLQKLNANAITLEKLAKRIGVGLQTSSGMCQGLWNNFVKKIKMDFPPVMAG